MGSFPAVAELREAGRQDRDAGVWNVFRMLE
jgi:hypothetical protein